LAKKIYILKKLSNNKYFNISSEELNGDLALYQNLLYQRLPNVFSTQIPITLKATVSDDFQAMEKVPTVYRWYKQTNISTRTLLDISLKPVFTYTFSSPGNFILQSDVKMIIEDPDFKYLDDINDIKALSDEDCIHKHSSNVKCGGFKQTVSFKGETVRLSISVCSIQQGYIFYALVTLKS